MLCRRCQVRQAAPHSIHCGACKDAHKEYVRQQRGRGYDPADHAGKRAKLVELARKVGLVR